MQVSKIQNNLNFKGATLNINALSDTHGRIEACDSAYKIMSENKEDIFEKNKKGKKNYLIIGGDWFISGETTGFLTHPDKALIWYQKEMLNKFIGQIKKDCPSTKTLFIPGNHDLDCGIELFCDSMENFRGTLLMSNLDINASNVFKTLFEKNKLVSSQIDFVKDDKDKNKTHPVLNLGVSPVNLEYYMSCEGMELYDNNKISQSRINKSHYQKTLENIKDEIKKFKEQYKDGTVILTCHTGAGFADECAKRGDVDLIFDAHEHKDEVRFVNNTPIVALSQNFKKIVNAKIEIDDNNNTKITLRELRPKTKQKAQGVLGKFYKRLFKKDTEKIFTIQTSSDSVTSLDIKGIRYKNNNLANFVCDTILKGIQENDSSVQIFALNSSAIRGELSLGKEPTNSMFDVLNCLNGISKEQSKIVVNEVTGKDLIYMIRDNLEYNRKNKDRNPIIQYSGISVNKTSFLKALDSGAMEEELCKYVKLEETDDEIDINKNYKIANPIKYFIKAQDPKIKSMQEDAYPLNLNARDLFVEYFKNHKDIKIEPKKRLY